MGISTWFFDIAEAEVVSAESHPDYVGVRRLDTGNVAICVGDGCTNVFIEGTPADVAARLLRLLGEMGKTSRLSDLDGTDDEADWLTAGHVLDDTEADWLRSRLTLVEP